MESNDFTEDERMFEELFKDRFSEKDAQYMELKSKPLPPPTVIFPWRVKKDWNKQWYPGRQDRYRSRYDNDHHKSNSYHNYRDRSENRERRRSRERAGNRDERSGNRDGSRNRDERRRERSFNENRNESSTYKSQDNITQLLDLIKDKKDHPRNQDNDKT